MIVYIPINRSTAVLSRACVLALLLTGLGAPAGAQAQTPEQIVGTANNTVEGAKSFANFTAEMAKSFVGVNNTDPDQSQANAEQVATSTGGNMIVGYAGGKLSPQPGASSPPWGPAVSASWSITFVAPSGMIAGTGPVRAGDPDLRKTWVTVDESQRDSDGGYGNVACALVNPSDVKVTSEDEWDTHVSFQVSCPSDGLGYQYYRMSFDSFPQSWAHWDWRSSTQGLGVEQETESGGSDRDWRDTSRRFNRVFEAAATYRRMAWGYTRVCGYTATGSSTCWSNTNADQATALTVSAWIYYADTLHSLEFADPV